MDQSIIQQILYSFGVFRSGNIEEIPKANEFLTNIVRTPIFNDLFSIALSNSDPVFRYYSIIHVQISFNTRTDISPEEYAMIKNFILQYVSVEKTAQNCEYMISFACILASKAMQESETLFSQVFGNFFNDLIQLSIQMQENISVSLYFLDQLIENDIFNPEMFNDFNMGEISHNLIMKGLLLQGDSSTIPVRKRAIDLIFSIIDKNLCSNFLQNSGPLLEQMMAEARFSIYSDATDDQESDKFFSLLWSIAANDPDSLGDTFNFYLRFTFDSSNDSNLPPVRRDHSLLFFDGAFLSQEDIFRGNEELVLRITFGVMCSLCQQDPYDFQPLGSEKLIYDMSTEPDLVDIVHGFFMNASKEAKESGDIDGFRVSIECLNIISENCAELFEENANEVCELIVSAVSLNDPIVFASICSLIKMLSVCSFQTLLPIFDNLTDVLIKNFAHPEALFCLESLLDNSSRPPMPYSEFIGALVSLITGKQVPNDHFYIIIECITNIVRNIEATDEQLYANLRPFMVEFVSSVPETRVDIYQCFASCCKIAPRVISADLPQFIECMQEDLSKNSDPEAIELIAESVNDIISIIPESFYGYAQSFFQAFLACFEPLLPMAQQAVQMEEDAEPNEEKKELLYTIIQCQKTAGEILICLSLLFASYPNELSTYFGTIFQFIQNFLDSKIDNLVMGASESVNHISPFFSLVKVDPSLVVGPIITRIQEGKTETDIEEMTIMSLFNALSNVLIYCGEAISDEDVNAIGQFFIDCLNFQVHSILLTNSKEGFSQNLIGNLIVAINYFVMGGAFARSEKMSGIISCLLKYVHDKRKRQFQAFVISALSRICYASPKVSPDLAPMLIQTIMGIFASHRSITDGCKNNFLLSLLLIFTSSPEIVTPQLVEQTKNVVIANVNFQDAQNKSSLKKSAALLLITLCSSFHMQIDPGFLIGLLQIYPDYDDEFIFLYAKALFGLLNGNEQNFQESCNIVKMAAAIVGAQKWCIARIPQNVLGYFANILSHVPIEKIYEIMEFNQYLVVQVKKNMSPQ